MLGLIVCAVLGIFLWMTRMKKIVDIPGKTPDWLIGNIRDLFRNPLQGIASLYKFNRDGIASVFLFGRQTFVIGIPDYLVQVFKNVDRFPATSVHSVMFMGPRSLVHLMGDEWKKMRRVVNSAFNSRHFRNMFGHIFDRTSATVALFEEKIQDQEFNVCDVMKATTSDIIALVAFGYSCENIENYGTCVNSISQDFDFLQLEKVRREASLNPVLSMYWLPIGINKEYKRRRQNIIDVIQNIMNHREENPLGENDKSDFLQAITDAAKGSEISKDDIIDQLFTILFAGYDTTSVTLSWALWLISTHPQVEDQLLEEINGIELEYDNIRQLKYTDAVIKETLRLYAPAPITSRSLKKDTEFGNVVLPHDSFIFIPIDLVHRDPNNWENPDVFDPSRFYEKELPKAFMAFSQGQRNCPGMSLAMMEMKVILATLLKKFKFTTLPGQEIVPEFTGFVQKPKNGLRMKIKKRFE